MKAGRLISIVLLLQNRSKLTAGQLAEELEVSERTILRDMETLSAAGIPVYAERGQHGGWRLTEGYRTSLTGMRAEELAALLVAAHSELLGDLGKSGDLESGLQKLLAASPAEATEAAAAVRAKLHIDGAGWFPMPGGRDETPLLPVVQEAVWGERMLEIEYRSETAMTKRIVGPLGLVAKRSVWYLVAEDDSGQMRTFRVSRLLSAKMLPSVFEPPASFDLARYWERSLEEFRGKLPRYPARIRLREELASRLEKERFVQLGPLAPADDGWLEAEALFETEQSACEIALSFGPRLEVVEPQELRDRVADELAMAAMVYCRSIKKQ